MDFKLQSYGERAFLIQDLDETSQFRLIRQLERCEPEGFVEYVVGYSNMLFVFRDGVGAAKLPTWLAGLPMDDGARLPLSQLVTVPVCYDGEDLAAVAELAQLSEAAVIAIHCAPEYRVRMMGFSPGFPYLDGLDARLHLDRRASPRNHIAPGSVAIGGAHAGIYSVASPGGWHLLGRTELKLFKPDLAKSEGAVDGASAFALAPGDRVKFVEVGAV